MSEKILLVDGNSIVNRAFYGVTDLTNASGLHTNAVYGFLNTLFKVLDEEEPGYITVAFDMKAPTFRHELDKDYKGTRKGMPPELSEQMPVLHELLRAMGILTVEQEGLEADDLLGTLAKKSEKRGMEVVILTGDRDLLQLASDHIRIRIPKTKGGVTETENYYASDVAERYQVTPREFIEVKALMGDTADNIPGVPGIGEKTATSIIVSYGNIENALAHADEIRPKRAGDSLKEHYDMAVLSKKLATINVECDFEYDWDSAVLGNIYTEEARRILKELEFKNMLSRFETEAPANEIIEKNFRTADTLSGAEEILKKAGEAQRLAFYLIREDGRLLAVSLEFSENESFLITVRDDEDRRAVLKGLKAAIGRVRQVISLNLKEELSDLGEFSDEEKELSEDAGIAAYLLNPLKDSYSCEDLAGEYLSLSVPSRQELFAKSSLAKASEEKPDEFRVYGCYISYVLFHVMPLLLEKLEDSDMLKLYRSVEMPLLFTLYDMEREGIRVDAEALKSYGEDLAVRIDEIKEKIYSEAGEEFNLNSPKQLGVILFEKLGFKGGKKTKTGYSTSAEVLEKLAVDHPIAADILEYRQLAKLKSTYADALAGYVAEDGRIHTTFQQTVTATGRLSSVEPNLQNIPIRMEEGKQIRKVFIPKDGYLFVDADYSQIELRVLAHMSGDQKLIQAYREAQDIHRLTASQVFHVPFDEVTPLQRRNAKAVNFGIIYGISSFGLSQDLSITRREASEYIDKYFETYPQIKEFLDGCVKSAKENGFAVTMFGRRRPVPELKSSNFMQRSFGERVAMNAPVQGTAADIIKIAMVRVAGRLKAEGLNSRLLLQVHDELLVEADPAELKEVERILCEEMRGAADLAVPLKVESREGENWYEAH